MPETIDARGLTCPQPSDLAFRALFGRQVAELLVLVDDPSSRDHLERIARQLGYRCSVERKADWDEVRFQR